MRVSYHWLKSLIDFPFSPAELADVLTHQGITVDAQATVGAALSDVVVGIIRTVSPHPDADALTVLSVDVGEDAPRTIVCGAPNVAPGLAVPVALPGASLGDMTIKKAKVRGVVSDGMCCAADELAIAPDHEGLLVIDDAPAPGTPFSTYIDEQDTIFELDVPNNRPDLLCHIGIAREIAAHMTARGMRAVEPYAPPALAPLKQEAAADFRIECEDAVICPRYSARRIDNVRICPAPLWMQARLHRIGVRPINNVVDITNYVLYEYGHPLHAFDADRLAGDLIRVRRACDGEKFMTLDDKERCLDTDMVLICDAEKPIALAGVMGGAETEVTDTTTSVLLESAYFDPPSIRKAVKKLGLSSDASQRFERGVRGALLAASTRASQLLAEHAGGVIAPTIADTGDVPAPASVTWSLPQLRTLLGVDVSYDACCAVLVSLGFTCEEGSTPEACVTKPPAHRVDISCAPDIAEECVRVIGYDTIPTDERIPFRSEDPASREAQCTTYVQDILCGCGLQEAYCSSLISPALLTRAGVASTAPEDALIPMRNPSTQEQSHMRTSLYPGLLRAVQHNVAHGARAVRLYECGRIYREAADNTFCEEERCALILWGAAEEKGWWGPGRECDFFEAVRVVEILLRRLGIRETTRTPSQCDGFHPGRTALLTCTTNAGQVTLGTIAESDPRILREWDIPGRVAYAELSIAALVTAWREPSRYTPLPRYPSATRDVAFLIDATHTHNDVCRVIRGCDEALLVAYDLFDVYTGAHVPSGKKSMAYRMTYRKDSTTLTDAEVDTAHARVVEKLHSHLQIERR